MPLAVIRIKHEPQHRLAAFEVGLQRCGYTVVGSIPRISKDDILVVWNRYQDDGRLADHYEACGARVLVTENGWLGKDIHGRQFYALARKHHNGAGTWFQGGADRFSRLGVELKDWRRDGRHILVLPQRGIGPAGVKMPAVWPSGIMRRLKGITDRPIVLRAHPGAARPSMEPDLKDCWAAVTWGSGAGIHAIVAGIPVFHDMPDWIGAPAARFGTRDLEDPFLGDRLPMLRRLAWAQFSVDELQSGEPFRCLLT